MGKPVPGEKPLPHGRGKVLEAQASHASAGAGGVSDQDRTASQRKYFRHPPPVCWTCSGKGLGFFRKGRDTQPSETRTAQGKLQCTQSASRGRGWSPVDGKTQDSGPPPRPPIVCVSQFSRSVVSDSSQPHGLARPPRPSPTPGAYSNPCPLSW